MAKSALSSPMKLGGEARTKMPRLLYGTAWKKDKTAELVYQAIKAGFRGIDTAAQPRHYQEALVGEGIRRAIEDGIVERKDLFIQTKFTPASGQDPQNMPYDPNLSIPEQVRASIASSLANLFPPAATPSPPPTPPPTLYSFYYSYLARPDTASPPPPPRAPYLDSVLLHTPLPTLATTALAWATLSTAVDAGQIDHLGISNISLPLLAHLLHGPGFGIPPSVIQNRFDPSTAHCVALRRLCLSKGIAFQAFGTLGGTNAALLASEPVRAIVEALGGGVSREVALYALVMALEGVAVLDGTRDVEHMVEDVEGLDKVGEWALGCGEGEGQGWGEWERVKREFKGLIGEAEVREEGVGG